MYPELYHQQTLNQTCCSDLPIPQALYQPGMVLLPRWTTVCQRIHLISPPTIIYKTAAKDLIDQDPRTTHLEGNLGLNLNNKQSTQILWQPPLNVILAVVTTIETYTAATAETWPPLKHHSAVAYTYPNFGHHWNNIWPWPPKPLHSFKLVFTKYGGISPLKCCSRSIYTHLGLI